MLLGQKLMLKKENVLLLCFEKKDMSGKVAVLNSLYSPNL